MPPQDSIMRLPIDLEKLEGILSEKYTKSKLMSQLVATTHAVPDYCSPN